MSVFFVILGFLSRAGARGLTTLLWRGRLLRSCKEACPSRLKPVDCQDKGVKHTLYFGNLKEPIKTRLRVRAFGLNSRDDCTSEGVLHLVNHGCRVRVHPYLNRQLVGQFREN